MPSLPPAAARASASATRQACSTASTHRRSAGGAGDQSGLPAGGCTVESRSISGVTRTITGRILRNTAYLKRQLRDIFTPGATGRLTVAGKYYCDAEVQRCPAISAANLWPTFSFQLFCRIPTGTPSARAASPIFSHAHLPAPGLLQQPSVRSAAQHG